MRDFADQLDLNLLQQGFMAVFKRQYGDQNGATTEATVTRQGFMNDPLCKYHTLLFINGAQVGDNATFADWYADDAAAISDARSYLTAGGYHVETVAASHGEVRAANRFLTALQGKILTVHLTTLP